MENKQNKENNAMKVIDKRRIKGSIRILKKQKYGNNNNTANEDMIEKCFKILSSDNYKMQLYYSLQILTPTIWMMLQSRHGKIWVKGWVTCTYSKKQWPG